MPQQECPGCQRKVWILYRANPVGEVPAVWRCKACLGQPLDPELEEITEVLAPAFAPRDENRIT
jgi:hypothetical protein